jgi:hypothetical protein
VKRSRLYASLCSLFMLGALLWAMPAGAASRPASPVGHQSAAKISYRGKVNVSKLPTGGSGNGHLARGNDEIGNSVELDKGEGSASSAAPSLPPPSPAGSAVTTDNPAFSGFAGMNHLAQRFAGNGQQFSSEPPDQALCVGNGRAMEGVNSAWNFYRRDGEQLILGAITVNSFFGLRPAVTRPNPVGGGGPPFGPFVSDPKCYFDQDSGHWFATTLEIGQDRRTGAFLDKANTFLAVSVTGDPTGSWFIYRVGATNPTHPNCPCFGDQPLIGADANGFYLSTAEYDLSPFGGAFNGPQLYAIDKSALVAGQIPNVVLYTNLGNLSGTLQPATSPDAVYETRQDGTEYFLSGRDTLPDGSLRPGQVDEISAWSLTNTASLSSVHPAPVLQKVDVKTEVYGQPVAMRQRAGRRPLGTRSHVDEPLSRLNANDERMNQVVFADGKLWSGITTVVAGGGADRTGIAWFAVDPSVSGGTLSASVGSQGYVAVANENVAFPSIGVNTDGKGVMVMTLVGVDYYPSVAYTPIDATGTGDVHIAAAGRLPEDGFSCYAKYNFGVPTPCRWGDYSAAVAVPDGHIWFAGEYSPAEPRTFLANWGTFIGKIKP